MRGRNVALTHREFDMLHILIVNRRRVKQKLKVKPDIPDYISSTAGQMADISRFLQLADKYSDLQEIDAATVNELIEKIVIHNPKKIGGKKHDMIEVYFTCAGKIRIPLAKPEPLKDTEIMQQKV